MSIIQTLADLGKGRQIKITQDQLVQLIGRRPRAERKGDGTVTHDASDTDHDRIVIFQDASGEWVAFNYSQRGQRYRVTGKSSTYYDVAIVADDSKKTGYSISIAKYKHH